MKQELVEPGVKYFIGKIAKRMSYKKIKLLFFLV